MDINEEAGGDKSAMSEQNETGRTRKRTSHVSERPRSRNRKGNQESIKRDKPCSKKSMRTRKAKEGAKGIRKERDEMMDSDSE